MFLLLDWIKPLGITYLLTYKLSSDFLGTFFIAIIRSRKGYNNNPNALQLKSAFKRLLIRYELKQFDNSNCWFDSLDILHVTSNPQKLICSMKYILLIKKYSLLTMIILDHVKSLHHTSIILLNI